MKNLINLHNLSGRQIQIDMFIVQKFEQEATGTKIILKKGFTIVQESLQEITKKTHEHFIEQITPPSPPILSKQDIQDYLNKKLTNSDLFKRFKIPKQNVINYLIELGIYNANNNGKKSTKPKPIIKIEEDEEDEEDFFRNIGFLQQRT